MRACVCEQQTKASDVKKGRAGGNDVPAGCTVCVRTCCVSLFFKKKKKKVMNCVKLDSGDVLTDRKRL